MRQFEQVTEELWLH